jgi:hypothetical protein
VIELNDETRWILGRPNFACAGLAECLRRMGHTVARKAEDEQAAAIHWMLTMYEQHGTEWREAAERALQAAKSPSTAPTVSGDSSG